MSLSVCHEDDASEDHVDASCEECGCDESQHALFENAKVSLCIQKEKYTELSLLTCIMNGPKDQSGVCVALYARAAKPATSTV